MNINPCRLLLPALLMCMISCQRELQLPPNPQPNPEPPDTLVTEPPPPVVPPDNYVLSSVHGEITDENGGPIQGVTVHVSNATAMTNEYGIFRIGEIRVAEHATFVRAEKAGYFTGSRTIISQPGGNGFVKIKMIRRQLKSNFSADQGTTVVINEFASVEIGGGAVVTSDGQPHHGTVNAYAAVINPEAQDFNEIMPGDLRGLNADSQSISLKSYGMITVELETETGAPLQLAEGTPAIMKMKVPASLVASAPARIPLWHFSETDGLWREQGLATLNNGWYSGTVPHFSTWNYDDPSAFVFVTLRVRGMKGVLRPYSRVKIMDRNTKTFSDLYTDSAGYIRTWVLKGSPLELQILNQCGDILHTEAQPALNRDTDLGFVYVGWQQGVLVTGSVHDCSNQPVTQGYATLSYLGLNYTTEIISGGVYFYLDKCDGTFDAQLYFTSNNNQSAPEAVKLSGQNQDLGVFTKCEPVDTFPNESEYVAYTIGTDSILSQGGRSIITYTGFTNGDTLTRISFTHRMYDVGAFAITVQFRDSSAHTSTIYNPSNVMLYAIDYIPVSPLTVNVKEYGPIGGEVFLTFTGTYKNMQTNEIVPLKGEMRVIRRQ